MNANSAGKDSQDLAVDRTDWAEDRTLLANERTFAGWMRTGMACIGIALALRAVFGDFDPTWLAKSAATLFIVIAVFIFWSARERSCMTYARFTENEISAQGSGRMTFMAILLSAGAIATGVILWLI